MIQSSRLPSLLLSALFAFLFVAGTLLPGSLRAADEKKIEFPVGQPALGGKTACRVDRCRGGLFAPEQERPRDLRRPGAVREALAHGRQRGHQN